MPKTPHKDLPQYADTLQQAAAMLGCTVGDLKHAKKGGCDGFRGSRVYLAKVEAWLDKNLPPEIEGLESKETLERRRLYEQVKTIRRNREILEGKYTPNDQIRSDMLKIGAATRGELLRLKADSPTWSGLSEVEIERRVDAMIETICRNLSDATSKLYK